MLLASVVLCALVHFAIASQGGNDYAGKCDFQVKGHEGLYPLDCSVALFSKFSFRLNGKLNVLPNDLCEYSPGLVKYSDSIVAVKRGQCAFDQKAIQANRLKFKALIILNSDESFPMGASNAEYVSSIPILMVTTNPTLEKTDVVISMVYRKIYP